MCTALLAPSPNRARKIRGLLLAYLALDADAPGVAVSHIKGRSFGHAVPVTRHGDCGWCGGNKNGCSHCTRGVIEYRELSPRLLSEMRHIAASVTELELNELAALYANVTRIEADARRPIRRSPVRVCGCGQRRCLHRSRDPDYQARFRDLRSAVRTHTGAER